MVMCDVAVDEEENWMLRGRCEWRRSVDVLRVVGLCLSLGCSVSRWVALIPS